jgi:hypothetical protein
MSSVEPNDRPLNQTTDPEETRVPASPPGREHDRLRSSPEMLHLLREASEHCEGQVRIVQARQGSWPDDLRHLRRLESEGYLELLATRDEPHGGRVTATYAITAKGRKAVAFCDDESGPKKADWR